MEGRRGRRGRRFYFLSKKRLGSGNRLRSSSWRNASGMHPSGMEVISQSAWRGFRHSASSGIEIQRHFRFTSSDIFPNISAQLKNCIQQSSPPPPSPTFHFHHLFLLLLLFLWKEWPKGQSALPELHPTMLIRCRWIFTTLHYLNLKTKNEKD